MSLGLLVLLYFIAGTLGGLIKTGEPAPTDTSGRIGLLKGPIHTDLLIPITAQVRQDFAFLNAAGLPIDHPQAQWLLVGWGARDFYMATGDYTDLRPGPVWRAITGDRAVIRVLVVGGIADAKGIVWISATPDQVQELQVAVRGSFASPIPLAHAGLSDRDAFFPATGRFNIFRTCNVWVGDVLRSVGVRVGVWTPFTWSL